MQRFPGANGGAKQFVSAERWQFLNSPNRAETQRPALGCAGRAGLRIESSTTELRWRPPNLVGGCSMRYSAFGRFPPPRLDPFTREQRQHRKRGYRIGPPPAQHGVQPKPRRVLAESQAQTMVSCASARSARLPRLAATRSFARARRGITINESAVSTIPTTLSPGRWPVS